MGVGVDESPSEAPPARSGWCSSLKYNSFKIPGVIYWDLAKPTRFWSASKTV